MCKFGGDSMANSKIFILYGLKDSKIFYIANTNPIIWIPDIRSAKIYYNRYTAEYSILRDYDNYRNVSDQINHDKLDEFYIAEYDKNYREIERYRLL